jgi:membrane-associated phospholipid phosphatase
LPTADGLQPVGGDSDSRRCWRASQSAAHGLSCPSGHAMVIFAITALVAPTSKAGEKVLPWALAAAVCLSRVYLEVALPRWT